VMLVFVVVEDVSVLHVKVLVQLVQNIHVQKVIALSQGASSKIFLVKELKLMEFAHSINAMETKRMKKNAVPL